MRELSLFDLDFFLEQGYCLIDHQTIKQLCPTRSADEFAQNIISFRTGMKDFFGLPLEVKKCVEVGFDRDPLTRCHPVGYWAKSTYQDYDPLAQVNFDLEYYNCRNYYSLNSEPACLPTTISDTEIEPIPTTFPHEEAHQLGKFLDREFITPIFQQFSSRYKLKMPSTSLQVQCAYYSTPFHLAPHTDQGFFEGIIGPANGLTIYPSPKNQPIQVNLQTGDILFYTGLEFQDFYSDRISDVPVPLLHGVEANARRMSVLLACLLA